MKASGIYKAYCIKDMEMNSVDRYTVGTIRAAQVFYSPSSIRCIVLFAGDDRRYLLGCVEPCWDFELLQELSQ